MDFYRECDCNGMKFKGSVNDVIGAWEVVPAFGNEETSTPTSPNLTGGVGEREVVGKSSRGCCVFRFNPGLSQA